LNILFAVGVALIIISTLAILTGDYGKIYFPDLARWIFGILSAISLVLMLYSLFFALPFKKTYMEGQCPGTVVDRGMYALCRHPGVIWFCFFYLFLFFATGIRLLILAWIIWTVMDVIHVYVQDRWIFPKSLIKYDLYKTKTPFLIPSKISIRQCITTFR
jgi:protein-S-isoprenylcysteine O-methyltransferase Ste14